MTTELDAIVFAEGPLAQVRIAGLTACERAVRVAKKVGATHVFVIRGRQDRDEMGFLAGRRTLVIRADQLVHTGLVQPLIDAGGSAVAVVPDAPASADLAPGSYAGAFVADAGDDATVAIAAFAGGASDADAAAKLAGAARLPHGAVARAPIATPAERRAAHALLYRILVKPQDNAITRYLYRPVSFPLTRLLAKTPITPNQISYVVALMVAIGCWITAQASARAALAGTAIVLAASYLDCCDGEIARVKLLSSRLGAWLDTIVDELSSVGYMAALGWHCHLAFGPRYLGDLGFDPWLAGIALGCATYAGAIYCIYYNLIVVVGSANSQDYVGRFEIAPGAREGSVRLRPVPPAAPVRPRSGAIAWLATYAPYVVRRDFISWVAVIVAAAGPTDILFAGFLAGGAVTFVVVGLDHVRLRALRRSIVRTGRVLEAPDTT